nr:Hsp20/alpha crystallin family protein [Gammaproteobacteria bacterium]
MAKEQVPVGKEKDVHKEKEAKEVERPIHSRGLIPFEDIERMFEDFVSQKWLRPFSWDMPSWTRLAPFEGQLPKVDVIDGDDEIVVRAELPGVRKEDIDVSLTENTLTIKASTKREEEEEKGEYYRRERTTGAYSRTLTLPGSVDESKARATFTEGLLELAFPKRGGSKRQRIKVE